MTILYGLWPLNPDDPMASIQLAQSLDSNGAIWFPKGPQMLVRVWDIIRLWDGRDLEINRIFRKDRGKIEVSKDFYCLVWKGKNANIRIMDKAEIEVRSGLIDNYTGIQEEALLSIMRDFGYVEP